MAGFGFLGALAGSSGQALDAIKARQEREREERKMRMLEELRRDTAVYLADYEDKLKSDDVDEKLSSFDPTTGEFIYRNREGKELSRRKDPGMAEEYEFNKTKNETYLRSLEANIRQSDASAEASRASAAVSRRSLSKLDEADVPPTLVDRANEIAYRQKTVVDDLTSQGVPADVIQQTILRVLADAAAKGKSPAQAEQDFVVHAAPRLRGAYGAVNKKTGEPKNKYNTNTVKRRLDSGF